MEPECYYNKRAIWCRIRICKIRYYGFSYGSLRFIYSFKDSSFSVNIQGVASELSNESCRTISGDYSLPGAVMECSVSTKDPNTRFMINSDIPLGVIVLQ